MDIINSLLDIEANVDKQIGRWTFIGEILSCERCASVI